MFEQFFIFISFIGNHALVWFGLVLFVALQQKKRAHRIIMSAVSAITLSFIVMTILKLLFRVPRPISNFCPTDYSFPSGHASTSFAAAVMLAQFDPKRKWFYFLLASLISYSRIYLNCHYLTDVVAGAILGVVVSSVVLKITPNLSKQVAKAKRSR